jgi:hypothetical protein
MNSHSIRPINNVADRDQAISQIHDAIHTINEIIRNGIGAGISVELVRTSRCHDGIGNWGDQMRPVIREAERLSGRI